MELMLTIVGIPTTHNHYESGMTIRVYIDGEERAELRSAAFSAGSSSSSFGSDMVCARMGTCFRDRLKSTLAWRMGGFWMFEDELSAETIQAVRDNSDLPLPLYDSSL